MLNEANDLKSKLGLADSMSDFQKALLLYDWVGRPSKVDGNFNTDRFLYKFNRDYSHQGMAYAFVLRYVAKIKCKTQYYTRYFNIDDTWYSMNFKQEDQNSSNRYHDYDSTFRMFHDCFLTAGKYNNTLVQSHAVLGYNGEIFAGNYNTSVIYKATESNPSGKSVFVNEPGQTLIGFFGVSNGKIYYMMRRGSFGEIVGSAGDVAYIYSINPDGTNKKLEHIYYSEELPNHTAMRYGKMIIYNGFWGKQVHDEDGYYTAEYQEVVPADFAFGKIDGYSTPAMAYQQGYGLERLSASTLNQLGLSVGFVNNKIYIIKGSSTQAVFRGGVQSYSSSDKKIATVGKDGYVKGKKPGTVTITAIGTDGKKYTCKAQVCINNVKFTNTKKTIILKKNKTVKLKVKGGGGKTTWVSTNPSVATVTQNGKVKAVSKGTTWIKVTRAGQYLSKKVKVK